MRILKLFMMAGLFLSLSAFSKDSGTPAAKAVIFDAQGSEIGSALFYKTGAAEVKMEVEVHGLKSGEHGMHIHGAAKCIAPDFKSAGPHFNPSGKKHGLKNPEGHHMGDMPNLTADATGHAAAEATLQGLSLEEGALGSLFQPNGTALVIHAGPDDEMSDPAGNSGDRIACGAIQKI